MAREGEGEEGEGGDVKDGLIQRGKERLLHEGEDSYKRKEGVVAAFKTELLGILCLNPGPRAKVLVTSNTEYPMVITPPLL